MKIFTSSGVMKFLFVLILFYQSLLNLAFSQLPILNFSKVNEAIYRGARPANLEAFEFLKNKQIKNIINLQGGDLHSSLAVIIPWAEPGETTETIEIAKKNALKLGLGYLNYPLDSLDEVTALEDQQIDDILEFIHNEENQPVFVHCEHGADRTGLIIALYRVKYEGISINKAKAEWNSNGHNSLHRLFTKGLDRYFYFKVKQFE